ncbi:MAG: NHL repeat-containing protein [Chloroflexota bacterium]
MLATRLDSIARSLAARTSRRTGLAAAVAAVAAASSRDAANAAPAGAGPGRDADCWSGRDIAPCITGAAGCARCTRSLDPVCRANACVAGSWEYQKVFGKRGAGQNKFRDPEGVFLSSDALTAWVADTENHRISIWTRPGVASRAWGYSSSFGVYGSGPGAFAYPTGVFISADGRTAWVADNVNSRVSVWTRPDTTSRDWSFRTTFGSAGSGDFNLRFPEDIAASTDGLTVWVADTRNHRVTVWTRPATDSDQWTFAARIGSRGRGNNDFRLPESVAVSPDSLTIWVADTRNHRVSIWSRPDDRSTAWRPVARFGTRGVGAANFEAPRSIAVSPDTLSAWIADDGNHRVSVWTRADRGSNAWSPAARFGSPTPGARFLDAPNGVAISPDSLTVVVADLRKSRISTWIRS